MQEISDWLRKLGMSEYAQRFSENDIDVAVLPHLTDQRASAEDAARHCPACRSYASHASAGARGHAETATQR